MKYNKYSAFIFVYFVHFAVGESIFNARNAAENQQKYAGSILNAGLYASDVRNNQQGYNKNERDPNIQSGYLAGNLYPYPGFSNFKDSQYTTANRNHPLICNLHPDFCNDEFLQKLLMTSEIAEEIIKIVSSTIQNFRKLDQIIARLQNMSTDDFDLLEFGVSKRNNMEPHGPVVDFSNRQFGWHPGGRGWKEEMMPFNYKSFQDTDEESIINSKFQNRNGRNIFDVLQNISKYRKGNVDKGLLTSRENYDSSPEEMKWLISNNNMFMSRFRNQETEKWRNSEGTNWNHLGYRLTTGKGLKIKETCQCTNLNDKCRFFQTLKPETDILPENVDNFKIASFKDRNKNTDIQQQAFHPLTEEEEELLAENATSFTGAQLVSNFYRVENGTESLNGKRLDELQLFLGNNSRTNDEIMFETIRNIDESNAEQPGKMYDPKANILNDQQPYQILNNADSDSDLSNQFLPGASDFQTANYEGVELGDQLNIGMDLLIGLMQQFNDENEPAIGNLDGSLLPDTSLSQ